MQYERKRRRIPGMLKVPTGPAEAGRYRIAWSGDPAFKPLTLPDAIAPRAPDETTAAYEAREQAYTAAVERVVTERRNALRVARETQDWSALLAGAEHPTYFVCRWLPEMARARWNDSTRGMAGEAGLNEALSRLLLLALEGIENYAGKLPKARKDPFWGSIVPDEYLDELLRAVGRAAMSEFIRDLAAQIIAQEGTTGPLF